MTTRIISEDVEPFAAMLIGRMWARVEAAKNDEWRLHDACMNLWWAVMGLEKIAIAVRGGLLAESPDALHFSIASSNHVGMVAKLIRETIKVDPVTAPGWGYARPLERAAA